MSEFFDEKQLEKLPPAERAEIIKKRQFELEQQLKDEAKRLEERTLEELAMQKKLVEEILESDRKVDLSVNSPLEDLSSEAPKLDEVEHSNIDYGSKVTSEYIHSDVNSSINFDLGEDDSSSSSLYKKEEKRYLPF